MSIMSRLPCEQRRARGTLWIATLALLTGCGNLTPGGFGEARVLANADAPDTAVQTGEVLGVPARTDHDDGDDEVDPDGELELSFRLYLESDRGAPLPLSDRQLDAELDLDGSIEADVVTVRVPADVYRALRIVFSEIEVEVASGVIIDGQPITGPIDIEIEGVEVERAINLTVLEGSMVEILLDLNAATWLQWVDTSTQPYSVRAEDFAEAFSVRIR